MVRWVCLIGRGRPHPLTVLHEAVIDLFTFSDRWNVNQMQATFTMGCGQATPTGGKETHRPCTHWAETLRYTLIPVDKNIAMPKNCCVVKCSNWMGKKEGLRFPRLPANDKERRQRWTAAARRQNWQPGKSTRTCNAHFTTDKTLHRENIACESQSSMTGP
jgi:hypothetical protein